MLWENNIVGQTIRSVRKAKGMSQEVLSGFAGIARTHLTMIECGTKQANFSTICKIAEAFDMRPSELVRKMEEAEEKREKANSSEGGFELPDFLKDIEDGIIKIQ